MEYSSLGIQIIAKLKPQKFELLCDQVLLGLAQNKERKDFFSSAELQQLQSVFGLKEDELELLLDTLVYMFQQMAYLKSMKLIHQFLLDLQLEDDHIAVIGKVWKDSSPAYLDQLKDKNVCQANVLESFNYIINMPMGMSSIPTNEVIPPELDIDAKTRIKKDIKAPQIHYLFNLKKEGQNSSELALEFDKCQMQTFFQHLEQIQVKLDELTQ